jgi:hypothetical protein
MKEESKKSILNYVLNISIIVFTIICLVLGYSLFKNSFASRQDKPKSITDTLKTTITNQPSKAYQIDVQNGTGENCVAADFRAYLKKKGFDVVEMGNYKNTDVNKTMVIDRTGNKNAAKKVAESLGINEKNIIQQKDTTSFLDATVIIGKDYQDLNPFKEKVKK